MKDNENSNLGGCNKEPKHVANLGHILEARSRRPVDRLQAEHNVENSHLNFSLEQLVGK